MNAQLILGLMASALGIWYAVLGFRAIQYLKSTDGQDRAVGWSLWWCLESDRYEAPGTQLCKLGQMLAIASSVIWLAVFMVRWG